jgi:hypothetical protein
MPAGVVAANDEADMRVPGPMNGRGSLDVKEWGEVGAATSGDGVGRERRRSWSCCDGVGRAASWRVWREPRAKKSGPTRRLGETRRTRLELDDPLGVSMSTIV